MLNEQIYLKEVLDTMKKLDSNGKAVPFAIKYRTYNRFSKTGGKLKSYENAKLVMKEEYTPNNSINALRTKIEKTKKSIIRRNPNHFENKTRNIKIIPTGEIRKINIKYIIEFNVQKVIY